MSEFIKRRERLVYEYAQKARYYKVEELPDTGFQIARGDKAVVFDQQSAKLTIYVNRRRLWRKKLESELPIGTVANCSGEQITLQYGINGLIFKETISLVYDQLETETYFLRSVSVDNSGPGKIAFTNTFETAYFPEGALSDFTYASYKWMERKENLGTYPYPRNDYLSVKAHNQLFYNFSGGIYCGVAYLDTNRNWESDLQCKDAFLSHKFYLREPLEIKAGENVNFDYLLFAGLGRENHIGHLSNVLWRLNGENDSEIHCPQTDMRDYVEKLASTWERSALDGNVKRDHYAAHYFSDFFGQFPDGYRPDDQFGCSWLEYDLLKAGYYQKKYAATGDVKFRAYAKNIIDFYLYDHYVGSSSLTYPFHTGAFMKTVLPFCEKSGWGAPFEPDCVDSLALPEMIYDALIIFEQDRSLFQNNYPVKVLEDVLSLQQPDGHFRRLYNSDLKPAEKIGWVNQYSETQTWIPVLLKLAKLTEDKRPYEAALITGERCWLDIQEHGLFAMGGCETDYPDYWDVDGYRTMLWAFLDLYDVTGEQKWAERAEDVQLFNNNMMLGYNLKPLKNSFYDRINWKCRGMVATSFYPHPDYTRLQCTATGNQSVCWIARLLMRLYDITSKEIYAQRAIAAFRQVMVFRDEKSLEGNMHREDLLYTIMENNPQMDDESGFYERSIAQNSTSAFTDLYVYLNEIIDVYGGLSIRFEKDKQHVWGLDCLDILFWSFSDDGLEMTVRNTLPRKHKTTLKIFGAPDNCKIALGKKEVRPYKPSMEIVFGPNEEKTIMID